MTLTHSSGTTGVEVKSRSDGSLEPTHLLDGASGSWCVSLYPEAGEATILRLTNGVPPSQAVLPPPTAEEEEQLELARVRRSQGKLRRYMRANRLGFLWTLTFAQAVTELAEAQRWWDRFARRLRERLGRFPLVAVFELHPGGHGWHIHWATDRFLSIELVRSLWGRGIVDVGDRGRLRTRVGCRELARYLAKYLGKSAGQLPRGCHRFRVSQGFSPAVVRRYFSSPASAYGWLKREMGDPANGHRVTWDGAGEMCGWWLEYSDRQCCSPPWTGAARERWPDAA